MRSPQIISMLALGALVVAGCRNDVTPASDGTDTDGATQGGSTSGADGTGEPEPVPETLEPVGLRRLTRYEYDNTLRDLLGDTTRPGSQMLPEDPFTPFDNEYGTQEASQPLIEGLEVLARDAAQRLRDDPARRDEVLGCTPAGTADEACLRDFVGRFGRRALRRPLGPGEADDYVALGLEYAERESDFHAGVEVVVRALLQDAQFVYRVEIGTPVEGEPGLFALDGFEIATRLSYLLWGSTPSDALLDAAEAGELGTAAQREAMVQTMLQDPRARVQLDRFHAMWLGYAQLPHAPELTNALRSETTALLKRVIFDEGARWTELFTAPETFIDASLAEHYDLPAPGDEQWVSYGDSGRQGILSHGSFLSAAAGPGETSPTRRGKWIREQLMCQVIPPPPPNIDADNPPSEEDGECKEDRYAVHAEEGSCAGCHSLMDPIGFGLERYDTQGRYRTHDEGAPQCTISGDGELTGLGTFNGPAELSNLLIDNMVLEPCMAQQLYRFALGREVLEDELPRVSALGTQLTEGDGRFDTLLGMLAADPAFAHRREE